MILADEQRRELQVLRDEAPFHIRGSASMDPDFMDVMEADALLKGQPTMLDYRDKGKLDDLFASLRQIISRPRCW